MPYRIFLGRDEFFGGTDYTHPDAGYDEPAGLYVFNYPGAYYGINPIGGKATGGPFLFYATPDNQSIVFLYFASDGTTGFRVLDKASVNYSNYLSLSPCKGYSLCCSADTSKIFYYAAASGGAAGDLALTRWILGGSMTGIGTATPGPNLGGITTASLSMVPDDSLIFGGSAYFADRPPAPCAVPKTAYNPVTLAPVYTVTAYAGSSSLISYGGGVVRVGTVYDEAIIIGYSPDNATAYFINTYYVVTFSPYTPGSYLSVQHQVFGKFDTLTGASVSTIEAILHETHDDPQIFFARGGVVSADGKYAYLGDFAAVTTIDLTTFTVLRRVIYAPVIIAGREYETIPPSFAQAAITADGSKVYVVAIGAGEELGGAYVYDAVLHKFLGYVAPTNYPGFISIYPNPVPSGWSGTGGLGLGTANLGRPRQDYSRAVAARTTTATDTSGINFWRSVAACPAEHFVHGPPPAESLWDTGPINVTTTAGDRDPRLTANSRGDILMVFTRPASGVMLTTSKGDDGKSWEAATLLFTGGHHPSIISDNDKTLAMATVSGSLKAVYQGPSDSAFGTPYTVTDDAGTALAPADDSFGLAVVAEAPNRTLLHILIGGDAATSLWENANEGAAKWKKSVASVIPGGRHPQILSWSGKVLLAAVTGTVGTGPFHIQGRYQGPGDAALGTAFTFQDSTGTALSVQDDGFSLAQAAEGPDRTVLHVLIAGETSTSEWYNAGDAGGDGKTWTRIPTS